MNIVLDISGRDEITGRKFSSGEIVTGNVQCFCRETCDSILNKYALDDCIILMYFVTVVVCHQVYICLYKYVNSVFKHLFDNDSFVQTGPGVFCYYTREFISFRSKGSFREIAPCKFHSNVCHLERWNATPWIFNPGLLTLLQCKWWFFHSSTALWKLVFSSKKESSLTQVPSLFNSVVFFCEQAQLDLRRLRCCFVWSLHDWIIQEKLTSVKESGSCLECFYCFAGIACLIDNEPPA